MTNVKLRLPGELQVGVVPVGLADFEDVAEVERCSVTTVRSDRDARSVAGHVVEAQEGDVLQLGWQGGVFELVRVSDLRDRFEQTQLGRGVGVDGPAGQADADELIIPFWQALPDNTRGLGRLVLESVEHLRIKSSQVLGSAFPPAIRAIEERFVPETGLFVVNAQGQLAGRFSAEGLGPYLILLHGTFSSTSTAFADLFSSADWHQLYQHYVDAGGGVLALEQRTVTDSPAFNALELAAALPDGSAVHLLSHSRGGIVGELLLRHPWSEDEVGRFFPASEYAQVRADLDALSSKLGEKKLRVERFVRVAAPTGGTLLASERLDRYLSVFLTLVGTVVTPAAPWFSLVKAIATQLVATRTRPDVCPGLEAMMPHLDRGFVPFLNLVPKEHPSRTAASDLAVVSGDVEGGGVLDHVKEFFTDLYFREDNDFVVDTKSMYRGVPRNAAWSLALRGPKAHHLAYFATDDARRSLCTWLQTGSAPGFVVVGQEPGTSRGVFGYGVLGPQEFKPKGNRPIVYVLPGIMGSHLALGTDQIWVDFWDLAWGGMNKLRYQGGPGRVVAPGVIEGYYGRLARYLNGHADVRVFAFDWRLPIQMSADSLARDVSMTLAQQPNVPVRILAHSMGGLVARAFIAKYPEVWAAAVRRGGRLLMLGTPNFGSYVPAQVFAQQHSLTSMLAALDFTQSRRELVDVVKGFPGLVEMLPVWREQDLFDSDAWQAFAAFRPNSELLNQAKQFRRWLDKRAIDGQTMTYVAGLGEEATAFGMFSQNGESVFGKTAQGDGTVPWSLGLLPGVDTYYVAADHGGMSDHLPAFEAYLELLATGATFRLAKSPVGLRRTREFGVDSGQVDGSGQPPISSSEVTQAAMGSRLHTAASDELRYFPSPDELVASIMGRSSARRGSEETPIDLEVLNDDVRNVVRPVIVGHYDGDPILSVEAVLDARLGGELSRDQRLGVYPGKLRTSRCYRLKAGSRSQGAIVVGLGEVGSLTRLRLADTVAAGLLEYALGELQRWDADEPLQLSVASVLVGTWGTRLSVDDAVSAVVEAATGVNQRLAGETLRTKVRIIGIQLVELHRDQATQAARAALRVAERSNGAARASSVLHTGKSYRRSRPSPYAAGWQRRVVIQRTEQGALEFDVVTELARTERADRRVQWELVKPLLQAAPHGDSSTPATLSQYLLPREHLAEVEESADMVLQLDEFTAQVPWELLDPSTDRALPLGVRIGVLRNLQIVNAPRLARSNSRRALVIGPPLDCQPPLPGARDEARQIAQDLSDYGLEVTAVLDGSANQILSALYRYEYDVIHIAGHGRFDDEVPENSGVVLGPTATLSTSEFENLRAVPSVVVLNCCHLGKMHLTRPGEWSASLAKKLVEMGIAVVVTAGWAVSDAPALAFAQELYAKMLNGRDLMTAVREARQTTHRVGGLQDLTWGAYQVYGSPGFVLRDVAGHAPANRRFPRFVAAFELVEHLLDVVPRVADGPAEQSLAVRAELDYYWDTLPQSWSDTGAVYHAFGCAYAALTERDRARECLERATACSDAPLAAVEQLARLDSEQAEQLRSSAHDSQAAARQRQTLLKKSEAMSELAIQRIEALIAVRASAERHILAALSWRRYARCAGSAATRRQRVARALAAYSAAAASGEPSSYRARLDAAWLSLCSDPANLSQLAAAQLEEPLETDEWYPLDRSLFGMAHDAWLAQQRVEAGERRKKSRSTARKRKPTGQLNAKTTRALESLGELHRAALPRFSPSQRVVVREHLETLLELSQEVAPVHAIIEAFLKLRP